MEGQIRPLSQGWGTVTPKFFLDLLHMPYNVTNSNLFLNDQTRCEEKFTRSTMPRTLAKIFCHMNTEV